MNKEEPHNDLDTSPELLYARKHASKQRIFRGLLYKDIKRMLRGWISLSLLIILPIVVYVFLLILQEIFYDRAPILKEWASVSHVSTPIDTSVFPSCAQFNFEDCIDAAGYWTEEYDDVIRQVFEPHAIVPVRYDDPMVLFSEVANGKSVIVPFSLKDNKFVFYEARNRYTGCEITPEIQYICHDPVVDFYVPFYNSLFSALSGKTITANLFQAPHPESDIQSIVSIWAVHCIYVVYGILFIKFAGLLVDEKIKGHRDLLRTIGMSDFQWIMSWFLTLIPLCVIINLLIIGMSFALKVSTIVDNGFAEVFSYLFAFMLFMLSFTAFCAFLSNSIITVSAIGATIIVAGMLIIPALIPVILVSSDATRWGLFSIGFFPMSFRMNQPSSAFLDNLGLQSWKIHLMAYMSALMMFVLLLMLIVRPRNSHVKRSKEIKNLEVNDLKVRYNSIFKKRRVQAVHGISFIARDNGCTVLLGVNGAGKSSTMKAILGLTHGVQIKGYVESPISVGYCPQGNIVWPGLTLADHIDLFCHFKGTKVDYTDLLSRVKLDHVINKNAGSLSYGMTRRLCLALSLIGDPDLLIIDEAGSGLDPLSKLLLWDVIQETKQNSSIFLTSHSLDEAEYLADDILIMKEGLIVSRGTVTELFEKEKVGYKLIVSGKLDYSTIPQDAFIEETGADKDIAVHLKKMPNSELLELLNNVRAANPSSSVSLRAPSLLDVFLKYSSDE